MLVMLDNSWLNIKVFIVFKDLIFEIFIFYLCCLRLSFVDYVFFVLIEEGVNLVEIIFV